MPDSTSLDGSLLQNADGFTQSGDEWDVIQVNSRSFSMAARLLPKEMRADVVKLYAWCRWCDNAVDDAPSQAVARHRLQMLMQDVKAIDETRFFPHTMIVEDHLRKGSKTTVTIQSIEFGVALADEIFSNRWLHRK